jgi:hypothetical protein
MLVKICCSVSVSAESSSGIDESSFPACSQASNSSMLSPFRALDHAYSRGRTGANLLKRYREALRGAHHADRFLGLPFLDTLVE